jgi:drug/metabolite transporter (DMT)-like permease
MASWYALSVIALILMGTQRFLYKVSAERKCHTAWTTFSFMATVALLSSGAFVLSGEGLGDRKDLILIAAVNSASFVIGTLTHIEALKHIPTSVAYPIIRLNMVVVILFSILYFHDRITTYQVFGIGTAIGVIVILTREAEEGKELTGNIKRGLILVSISVASGAISSISSKFAAMYVNKLGFMALSYAMGMFFSVGMVKGLGGKEVKRGHGEAFLIGMAMGLINFVGFYLFLKALSLGPLSIIVSITGMHFVIAVILSVIIYGEKLNAPRILGIGLTVLSVILLRL